MRRGFFNTVRRCFVVGTSQFVRDSGDSPQAPMQPHRDDRERLNEVLNDVKRAAIAGEPAAGRLKPQSVASIAGSIRRFSCWLSEKKQGIVVRPHDASLDEDAKLYN
ncbi:hypothetical protein ACF1BQ_028925 [Bradyrhizobium sp. RDT10]